MILVKDETFILNYLNNIQDKVFNKITILLDKYRFEIFSTGLTNNISDMFECYICDDSDYNDTNLSYIFSTIQDIGMVSATIE